MTSRPPGPIGPGGLLVSSVCREGRIWSFSKRSPILDMLRRTSSTSVHDHGFYLQVLTASLVASGLEAVGATSLGGTSHV